MHSASLLALRLALGGFYVLARFRFFYDPSKRKGARLLNPDRYEHLKWKMEFCHYPRVIGPCVAAVEVLAGAACVVGLLTRLAALGLCIITLFATRCTWRMKIMEQHPVDRIDWLSCYLWRVEGLYLMLAAILVFEGPGAWALDTIARAYL